MFVPVPSVVPVLVSVVVPCVLESELDGEVVVPCVLESELEGDAVVPVVLAVDELEP